MTPTIGTFDREGEASGKEAVSPGAEAVTLEEVVSEQRRPLLWGIR